MRLSRMLIACNFLLALGLVLVSNSLTIATPSKSAKTAAAIVRLLESRYNSALSLKAAFLERFSQGPRQMRVESGTAYFRRPGRMRWEYEEPEKKLFIADGKTVWFYVPADKTVTRAPMKESSDWRTPLALLTGKANLSRLCGRVEIAGPAPAPQGPPLASVDTLGVLTLRCTPKETPRSSRKNQSKDSDALDEAAPFDEILLQVNPDTGDLADILIRQAGDVELEFRFGNWQRGLPLADSMFHFQAPPGVAILEDLSGSAFGR